MFMPKEAEFAVIVPSFNNAKWCQKNLLSIAGQTYPSFHLYYIDDASTDETKTIAQDIIASTSLKEKTTCLHNTQRKGSLANFYETIHQLEPHKIVVCVDGDDWLAHEKVLSVVASAYENKGTWLTYGDFEIDPKDLLEGQCEAIPEEVCKTNAIRSYSFVASHLKTFYAKLFQNIKKSDLMLDGHFFPMIGDVAFMIPMLEMASNNHFLYIPEKLYIYNAANPINDFKAHVEEQKFYRWIIHVREPYTPLTTLF